MIEFIEGLGSDVLAAKAVGKITHEDYRSVLIPRIEAMIATGGKIRMLYVIGAEFEGFQFEAIVDDGLLGIRHWNAFTKIAVVTDRGGLRTVISMFAPAFPGVLRLFRVAELAAARVWISQATE